MRDPDNAVPGLSAASAETETILVVDDDVWVRKIAVRSLRSRSYTVLEAGDGETALTVSDGFAGTIHLVLSDAIMPGMSGAVVVERLRRARPEIKAIFMSGYGDEEISRRGIDATHEAFVQKPFTTMHLLDRVREQLDRNERPTDAPEIAHDPLHRVISDPARLAVLRGTGLLDSEREEQFDRLTRLAARFLKTPAAFISLVDEHRDFYKAAHGFGEPLASARELRGRTFCHYTMRSSSPLVIPDTAGDPEYALVPTENTLGVGAYVGVALIIDGQPIGAMCAIDTVPREWTPDEVQALSDLAAVALDGIALREATRRSADAREALSRANVQMHLAKHTAEAANHAKAEFLANMSHELRTPLNSIIGFANVLRRNGGTTLGDHERNYIERIAFNGSHLLELVNRILDLSKIEQGHLQLRCTWVNLEDAVRSVCDNFAEEAASACVTLVTEVEQATRATRALTPLHTDDGKLRQILINLIGNALKFTAPGGRIGVTITSDAGSDEPRRLHVSDTGIGIAAEAQARIFDAFEQAEDSTSARFGGTGLGLRISRALCASLGFALSVTSVVGQGSTFTIDFAPPTA